MPLPNDLLDVLQSPAPCFLTTLMPDGSPQITQTWVDTDGENIVINTVSTHQKTRNVERDPRVAVAVADPSTPSRYWAVRGRVKATETEGAREHIDKLALKYLGRPYPGFDGGTEQRVMLTIGVDKLHTPRR
ncbi:PPOX class F420-dependent oxidoreductase OS=Streptomyces alboniger OX=132473 GN=CP975_16110 PE=4 SV=1 [Streptomyces alboniger]